MLFKILLRYDDRTRAGREPMADSLRLGILFAMIIWHRRNRDRSRRAQGIADWKQASRGTSSCV